MTREGIREGMRAFLLNMGTVCYNQMYCDVDEATDELMGKLSSLGVVIKVDRELPSVDRETGVYKIAPEYLKELLEAGYVAAESLVEEEE